MTDYNSWYEDGWYHDDKYFLFTLQHGMFLIGEYYCIIYCNERLFIINSHQNVFGSYVDPTSARLKLSDISWHIYIYIVQGFHLIWYSYIDHKIELNFE